MKTEAEIREAITAFTLGLRSAVSAGDVMSGTAAIAVRRALEWAVGDETEGANDIESVVHGVREIIAQSN